jgi:hypothetical protein
MAMVVGAAAHTAMVAGVAAVAAQVRWRAEKTSRSDDVEGTVIDRLTYRTR